MNESLDLSNLTDQEKNELHSLGRYPPMGLNESIDGRLENAGLVVCLQSETSTQTSRYRLTELGRSTVLATADRCTIGHCPCKGKEEWAEEVGTRLSKTLATVTGRTEVLA